MAKISIYSPSIVVPVARAALMRPDTGMGDALQSLGGKLINESERQYAAWEQKQKQDAQVALAHEKIKADHKFTLQFLEERDTGKLDDASPQRVIDGMKEYFTDAKERFKDNKYIADGLSLLEAELGAQHVERAITGAAAARMVRRTAKVDEAIDLATATAFLEPHRLDDVKKTARSAALALPAGSQERANAEEKIRKMGAVNIEGKLQSESLQEVRGVIASIERGDYKGEADGRELIGALNRARAREVELQDKNYLQWQGEEQFNAARGKKTGLPDLATVGVDNYNRAKMSMFGPPSATDEARQTARQDVLAIVASGEGIAPTNKGHVEAMNSIVKTGMEANLIKMFGEDENGNPAGTPMQHQQANDAWILNNAVEQTQLFRRVPDEAVNYLSKASRSKNSEVVANAASLFRTLASVDNGRYVPDLQDKSLVLYHGILQTQNTNGGSVEDATIEVQNARNAIAQKGPSVVGDLYGRFAKSNVAKDHNGVSIPYTDLYINEQRSTSVKYTEDFRARVKKRAMEMYVSDNGEGGIEAATAAAFSEVSRTYDQSLVNSPIATERPFWKNPFVSDDDGEMMQNAPEKLYGVPRATTAENAKWIQEQALEKVNAIAPDKKKFTEYVGNIRLAPAANNKRINGQPAYTVRYYDGAVWKPIQNPRNKTEPYLFVPNREQSTGAKLLTKKYYDLDLRQREIARKVRDNQDAEYQRAKRGQRPLGGYQ